MLNSKGKVIGIHVGHGYDARPSSALKALLANSTSTEPLEQWRKRKVVRTFVYYERGKKKYYDGNAEGAINDFNQAIELNPDDVETYKYRAKSKVKLEDYQAAIEDYNQAIKLNPNDASAYRGRGVVKVDLQDHAGAIEDLRTLWNSNLIIRLLTSFADTQNKTLGKRMPHKLTLKKQWS